MLSRISFALESHPAGNKQILEWRNMSSSIVPVLPFATRNMGWCSLGQNCLVFPPWNRHPMLKPNSSPKCALGSSVGKNSPNNFLEVAVLMDLNILLDWTNSDVPSLEPFIQLLLQLFTSQAECLKFLWAESLYNVSSLFAIAGIVNSSYLTPI